MRLNSSSPGTPLSEDHLMPCRCDLSHLLKRWNRNLPLRALRQVGKFGHDVWMLLDASRQLQPVPPSHSAHSGLAVSENAGRDRQVADRNRRFDPRRRWGFEDPTACSRGERGFADSAPLCILSVEREVEGRRTRTPVRSTWTWLADLRPRGRVRERQGDPRRWRPSHRAQPGRIRDGCASCPRSAVGR